MTLGEYIQKIKQNEEQLKKDMDLQKKLNKQFVLACKLKATYVHRRIKDHKIMSCVFIRDPYNRTLIDYRLDNHQRGTTFVDQVHTIGFFEWKYIARFIKGMVDKKLKEDIMSELILLVEVAHDLGKLGDFDCGTFCVSFNIKKDHKLVGLATQKEPEGLTFEENKYTKIRDQEGFFYKDNKGTEYF